MLATNHALPSANGFVVYDVETTGLSKAFDQITQVAAIRTDGDFNIIDKTHDILNLRGRRLPWIVPSPGAMLATRATADDYERCGSHYAMMSAVANAFGDWAPAIFIGYNSLRFDEEHIRNNLFATLHPPYLTSAAGSGRADAYQMLKVICALRPGLIALPEIDGKPSMKLGAVLRANRIAFGELDAHDALGDVRGTIALLKLMQERAPSLFDHLLRLAYRSEARAFLDANEVFAHVTWFGEPHIALSTEVAANPNNPNEVALFDLAHDPAPYLALSVEELALALRSEPRALRTVRLNAQPMLLPADMASATLSLDYYTIGARAVAIRLATPFQTNVSEAMRLIQSRYPKSEHVEDQIYDFFSSYAQKRLAARFHKINDWRERYRLVSAFEDARLRTHALRLIYAEAPSALPNSVLDAMHDWARQRLLSIEDGLPWLTLHAACEELAKLRELGPKTGGPPPHALAGSFAERLDEIERYYLMMASGHQ